MKTMTPEQKAIRKHSVFRIVITLVEIATLVAFVYLAVVFVGMIPGVAEELDEHEEEFEIAYAICTKGDRVNIRRFPNTKQEPDGYIEPGDLVYLDGKKRNGFLHCVGLNTEAGEGWIHRGYLVSDPPELINRTGVICARTKVKARKNVNGKRIRWLKPGGEVKVYYWSEEWCVTNCGYVMSKFIEIDGE